MNKPAKLLSQPTTTKLIQELRLALKSNFLERSDVIDGMLVTLISGEPLIMLGMPGTAKSALCNAIASSIQGDYFAWLLTKFTVPEEIYGPLSLKALEQDRYMRIVDGKLPSAHVVFLDEVGKCSSSLANTTLTAINEKTFYNDGKSIKLPLRAFYGASNEVPDAEELSAFYDRFVMRYYVDRIQSVSNARLLFAGIPATPIPVIGLDAVDSATQYAASLVVSDDVIEALMQVRQEILKEGFEVSDRKWRQCINVIKAYSFLCGKKQVEVEDVAIITNCLWSQPEDRVQVRKIVHSIVIPHRDKIDSIWDALVAAESEFNKNPTANSNAAIELFNKCKHASKQLEKIADQVPNSKEIAKEYMVQIKTLQHKIAKDHLKLEL